MSGTKKKKNTRRAPHNIKVQTTTVTGKRRVWEESFNFSYRAGPPSVGAHAARLWAAHYMRGVNKVVGKGGGGEVSPPEGINHTVMLHYSINKNMYGEIYATNQRLFESQLLLRWYYYLILLYYYCTTVCTKSLKITQNKLSVRLPARPAR